MIAVRVDSKVTQVAIVPTSFGTLLVGGSDRGLRYVAFGENASQMRSAMQQQFPVAKIEMTGTLQAWVTVLRSGLEQTLTEMTLPLELTGTPFQKRVWKGLQEIPVGSTESYAQLARRLGRPTATRAVAGACAANQLALAIPCHRVIRSDGKLGGYRWGLERKKQLLELERSVVRTSKLST